MELCGCVLLLVEEFSFGDCGLLSEKFIKWKREGIVEGKPINPNDGHSEFLHARFWESIGYNLIDVCITPCGLLRVIWD